MLFALACAGSRTAEVLASGTESGPGSRISSLVSSPHYPIAVPAASSPRGGKAHACLLPFSNAWQCWCVHLGPSVPLGSRSWCLGRCQGCSIYLSSYLAPGALQAWTSSSLGRLSFHCQTEKTLAAILLAQPSPPFSPVSLGWPRTGHQSRLGPADGFISHCPSLLSLSLGLLMSTCV